MGLIESWKSWYNQEDARLTRQDRERAQGFRAEQRANIEKSTRSDTVLHKSVEDKSPLGSPPQEKAHVGAHNERHQVHREVKRSDLHKLVKPKPVKLAPSLQGTAVMGQSSSLPPNRW